MMRRITTSCVEAEADPLVFANPEPNAREESPIGCLRVVVMEPRSSHLAAASGEATSEDHGDRRRRSTRDAACQTELAPEEEPGPAMTMKNFRCGLPSTTGPEEPSQKKAKRSGWSGPAGLPVAAPEIQAAAERFFDTVAQRQREAAAASARGDCSGASRAAAATIAARPLPLRFPPYPKNGKGTDVRNWMKECRRLELVAEDPLAKLVEDLPTLREPNDPDTAEAVGSSRDKAMVLAAARSIVSVSSVALDGKVICQCTGIVIGWNEANRRARILTCSETVCDMGRLRDPKPKVHVHLPNKTVSEGQLLFFNVHYDIALLEITADFKFQLPSFGSSPNYGQEVFVLSRDKESFLTVRHGRISWFEKTGIFGRNYHMFLSCELPEGGDGGSVIDHDGNVVGMSFYGWESNTTILAISTMLMCIEMWMKFSRIARPIHGLHLRTMEMMDVSSLETILDDYNIDCGYIVDKVANDTTAERLGIRRGDVIVSFDELGIHTLPKFEDLLLSLGWEFLRRGFDSSAMIDFKLEVYDLLKHSSRTIILPVGFCDSSELVKT
ncbi:hypothetical protein ACP70R_010499 [Stipagrostis hirtigluma subsp. patula]